MTRILIVDDDRLVREGTQAFLESHGYDAICASDGKEALERHRHEPADVMLIDIFMPTQGGFETIMSLRHSIPVIAMSGVGTQRFDPLSFAQSIGANKTLSKPFAPNELLQALRDVLPVAS